MNMPFSTFSVDIDLRTLEVIRASEHPLFKKIDPNILPEKIDILCNGEMVKIIKKTLNCINSRDKEGFIAPSIVKIKDSTYLLEIRYQIYQCLFHQDTVAMIFFNVICIDHFSVGRDQEGSFLRKHAVKMQLEAAHEQIQLTLNQ